MTALAPITVRGSFARASQTVGRCASERPRWPVGTGDSLTRPARWHQTLARFVTLSNNYRLCWARSGVARR